MYILERTLLDKRGTIGRLSGPNITPFYTLEEPWNGNKRGQSCIPAGDYICKPHAWGPDRYKFHFQRVWEVTKVPDRKAILIHAGNTLADTEGCILVGLHISGFTLLQSRAALNRLREAVGENYFDLRVINAGKPRE